MKTLRLTPYDITEDMLVGAFPVLTRRECKILRWLIHSKTDAEIAGILEICPSTVSCHVHHLLIKLGVENRSAASMEAVSAVLCRPPSAAR